MNKEEIENRIIVCEMKANAHREVGNTKTADRYDNEKYKWEKLLSDFELLDERKIKELLDYKKGYFGLEQQNKKYKEVIDKAIMYIHLNKQKTISAYGDNEDDDFEIELWEEDIDKLLDILKEGKK